MNTITIREVAKLAGVSVSTVSRVINNLPDVNLLTKQNVRKIIEDHGYVPNVNAKTLKQSTTNIICIIVKGIQNPFFAPIVEEIQLEIEKTRYIPLVHYIDESADEVRCAVSLVAERKALGVIFLGGNPSVKVRAISRLKVPCVLATMSAAGLDLKNASSVCVDDFASSGKAIDYLFDQGHQKIAILGGRRLDHDLVWNRYTGAKHSIEAHGFHFDENLYIESLFTFEDAYQTTLSALSRMDFCFTALFAMSDIMAIGATKAIFDSGRNVPGDISVVGFDGIMMANYYNPTLTTVRQPYREIARRSAALIIQNIGGENVGQNIVLDTEIFIGASVKNVFKAQSALK
jgi:LacI family transcriptional regulator